MVDYGVAEVHMADSIIETSGGDCFFYMLNGLLLALQLAQHILGHFVADHSLQRHLNRYGYNALEAAALFDDERVYSASDASMVDQVVSMNAV